MIGGDTAAIAPATPKSIINTLVAYANDAVIKSCLTKITATKNPSANGLNPARVSAILNINKMQNKIINSAILNNTFLLTPKV